MRDYVSQMKFLDPIAVPKTYAVSLYQAKSNNGLITLILDSGS